MKQKDLTIYIKIALLSAIAMILMYIDFPVIPLFPWLKIDLSEVPVLMGGFAFGPMAAIFIELIKNILIIIVKGTNTGFVGEIANFIVGISLVVPASIIYKRKNTKKGAIIGMLFGILFLEIIGIISNVYFLLPAYGMQMDSAQLMQYVTVGLIPFNGLKGIIVSIVTYLLYKKVSIYILKNEYMRDSII